MLNPRAPTHVPWRSAAAGSGARLLTESFPQSCMALLSTMMLTSCHLKARFWKSSHGFFALWPLRAACSASISSSSALRSLVPLSFRSAARTREPLTPGLSLQFAALQGKGLSSRWRLRKAAGQSLWLCCDLHRADQLWWSHLKDLGERECKSLTIVWQLSISHQCHFSSHASDSDLKWLPWEMQAIKMFLVHSMYFPENNSSHYAYEDLYATNLSKSFNMNWLQIWSWALQPAFISLHSYKTYLPLWTQVLPFDPITVANKSIVGRCLSITSIDQIYLRL